MTDFKRNEILVAEIRLSFECFHGFVHWFFHKFIIIDNSLFLMELRHYHDLLDITVDLVFLRHVLKIDRQTLMKLLKNLDAVYTCLLASFKWKTITSQVVQDIYICFRCYL